MLTGNECNMSLHIDKAGFTINSPLKEVSCRRGKRIPFLGYLRHRINPKLKLFVHVEVGRDNYVCSFSLDKILAQVADFSFDNPCGYMKHKT